MSWVIVQILIVSVIHGEIRSDVQSVDTLNYTPVLLVDMNYQLIGR